MPGYIADSQQNYSQLNPIPTYKKNLPSNYDQQQLKGSHTQNASVDYKNNNNAAYYEKSDETGTKNYDRARIATQGLFEKNDITKLFFSDENMNRMQQKIRDEVFTRTKGQYILEEDQDEADLIIAMRAVYLDKCKNLPKESVRQVKLLNQQTVDYILPDLLSNIRQYFGYIKDIINGI